MEVWRREPVCVWGRRCRVGYSDNGLESHLSLPLIFRKTLPTPSLSPYPLRAGPALQLFPTFTLHLPRPPHFYLSFSPITPSPGPCWVLRAAGQSCPHCPAMLAGGTIIPSAGQEREGCESTVRFCRHFKMLSDALTPQVTKHDLGCQVRGAGG